MPQVRIIWLGVNFLYSYKKADGSLSSDDVEDCVRWVIAQQRLEGLILSSDEIDMLRQVVRGDITDDEYMVWALKRAGAAE